MQYFTSHRLQTSDVHNPILIFSNEKTEALRGLKKLAQGDLAEPS